MRLGTNACVRPRQQASMLGGWRTKWCDFNALNFLDPIWFSPFRTAPYCSHLTAREGRPAGD